MGVALTPIIIKEQLTLQDLHGKRLSVDGNGELYALVTNTASNGTGGIAYRIILPEPAGIALLAGSLIVLAARRGRRRA